MEAIIESVCFTLCGRDGLTPEQVGFLRKLLEKKLRPVEEVVDWAQSTLTALNVGDVKSGSALHLKLRDVMIAYRDKT